MTAPYPAFDGTQACAGLPPAESAAFLPMPGVDVDAAKARCRRCRFRPGCRSYGLDHDVQGVWGELDDADRRALRAGVELAEPRPVTDELDDLVLASRATGRTPPRS